MKKKIISMTFCKTHLHEKRHVWVTLHAWTAVRSFGFLFFERPLGFRIRPLLGSPGKSPWRKGLRILPKASIRLLSSNAFIERLKLLMKRIWKTISAFKTIEITYFKLIKTWEYLITGRCGTNIQILLTVEVKAVWHSVHSRFGLEVRNSKI